VDKHKIQASVRNKGIKCTYSKVLRIRVTHTMILELITSWSKNHLRYRTKPKVMDATAAVDKVKALIGRNLKRWALQGHAQVDLALGTPCLGHVGLKT
jgi:hypothetical protein